MPAYKMFLDDVRDPPAGDFVVVRSYGDFVECLHELGLPTFVSFDHDLGETRSGLDCAKYIVEAVLNGNTLPKGFSFFVHSANPVGAANINGLLSQFLDLQSR